MITCLDFQIKYWDIMKKDFNLTSVVIMFGFHNQSSKGNVLEYFLIISKTYMLGSHKDYLPKRPQNMRKNIKHGF